MKGNRIIESRGGELVVLMGELKGLHEELLAVIQQKLGAMRRADTESLTSCQSREVFLADRIRQREGLRQQLVRLIGGEMGLSAEQAARMPLSQLAARLNESHRGRLLALAASTREAMLAVDRQNKVAALVTGEMLKHFRRVYSAMSRTGPASGTYSPGGRLTAEAPVKVFEAVG